MNIQRTKTLIAQLRNKLRQSPLAEDFQKFEEELKRNVDIDNIPPAKYTTYDLYITTLNSKLKVLAKQLESEKETPSWSGLENIVAEAVNVVRLFPINLEVEESAGNGGDKIVENLDVQVDDGEQAIGGV
jgi:CHAT domain-containing protein